MTENMKFAIFWPTALALAAFPFAAAAYASWKLGTPVEPGLIGGYAALFIGGVLAFVVFACGGGLVVILRLWKGERPHPVGCLLMAVIAAVAFWYAGLIAFSGSIREDLTTRGAAMTISGHMRELGGEGGVSIVALLAVQLFCVVGIGVVLVEAVRGFASRRSG